MLKSFSMFTDSMLSSEQIISTRWTLYSMKNVTKGIPARKFSPGITPGVLASTIKPVKASLHRLM